MIRLHPDRRRRILLIAISVVLLGIGSFITLMKDLERTPSSESVPTSSSSIPISAPSVVTASSTASDLPSGIVVANGREILVELALTAVSQERGLSYRDSLPADDGMLFVFDRSEKQTFWMNGMRFPLDMVFINGTRVVHVAANVPAPNAGQMPALISSVTDADKVLEVNAGKAKEWGIEAGTEIIVERPTF